MSLDTDSRPAGAAETAAAQEQRVVVDGDGVVTTPSLRRVARRSVFWVALAMVLVLFALITIAISGNGATGPSLSGTSAAPSGAKALMQVLRADGVTVRVPRTLDTALTDSRAGGTLAIYDAHNLLTSDQLQQLRGLGKTLVLIKPSFAMLNVLAPQVRLAGVGKSTFAADESSDCGFAPLASAGRVSGASSAAYRVVPSAGVTVQTCLPNGGDTYSLVTVTTGGTRVVVFGLPGALSNQHVIDNGNAALALGTFGQYDHLTWYLPSEADVTQSVVDRPVPLPGWVLPTEFLAVLVVLAAALWRGRRFGPLVIERLPVIVRASETMEGRARLYQRASARRHALDSLRIGTIGRLASLCGLPVLATVDEIIGAVAALTGSDPADIRALLVDEVPRNDSQLIALSDRLRELEATVASATRPT